MLRRDRLFPARVLLPVLLLLGLVSGCRTGAGTATSNATANQSTTSQPAASQPTVILLSFDGWRWDYDTKAPTPNLHRLMARGVRAERLIPSFPSKTFPNHYTIVTGLYPGHHGIVANNIYDPAMQASFSLSDRAAVGDGRWWGGEPIWVTAQRRGLVTATLYWPGSEAEISGVRPRYWKLYDEKTAPPDDERVDQILAWLDLPAAERPSFITGYFSDTDHAGHDNGPESPELKAAVAHLDAVLGRLLAGLDARGLTDRVNIVAVSDHGMSETSSDRVIVLADYVDLDTIDIVDINPTLGIIPKAPATVDEVYRRLAQAHPHLKVYRKAETPEAWHYRDHPRVPPIVGVADDGWVVVRRQPKDRPSPPRIAGTHGYAPDAVSMHGLFVAAGPAFRRGLVVPPFENVDVYDMLASALHLPPAPNDGDPAVARRVMVSRP
jgi:predicted AlkP superfamily pyrophosphatase or phosphodiesterase